MTGYDLILYFTPIRVLKFSHNNQKHFWGNVLHFLTFSLSRNWYNGYIDKTKICGTLSNLTKICLIKLNKTKTYNYLYLTKLYIDICILSCFFFYHSFDGHGYFRPGSERSQRSVDRLFRPYWWQTFHFLPKYYI